MRKSWLLCLLLGTMAWGQAKPEAAPAPPSPAQAPSAAAKEATPPPAEIPESAVVLTVTGVCPPAPKAAAAASKTAASKTTAAKTTAAVKPADCKTVLTREQFEKIASGLSPNLTPQLKRQLATALPRFIAMSEAAKEQGLDKSPRFQEMMKFVKMQLLTRELERTVQEQADKIPPQELEDYYKKHSEAYEQLSLDRLFIPRYKQTPLVKEKDDDDKEEKLTEEQQKAKDEADKAKQEAGAQELDKLADSLRARAAAGEDFTTLQKEAFEASGMKMEAPNVNLPTVRRTGLPQAHAAVFELKVGEVSAVISDNGGHTIYKVVTKEVLPLDAKLKEEVHNKLKSDHIKEVMDKYQNSYHAESNEAYLGPAGPPAGPMGARPGVPRMPRPGQGGVILGQPKDAPPAANPPAQAPAQPTPPPKQD